MPTIQFTYDKENNLYCFGFWVKDKFIVRSKGQNRQKVMEQFIKELEQLEESRR